MMVSARDVSFYYPSSRLEPDWVLSRVDIEVAQGKILAVVGKSGCGKSTLIKLLAGLIDPIEGEILLGGKKPKDYREARPLGAVFQRPSLLPWRTVENNIRLPSHLRKAEEYTEEIDRRLEQLLNLTGLEFWRGRFPAELSGGMAQRAALAVGMILDPEILFLDEAFSSVDEITREQLWIELEQLLSDSNTAVLLVTHSIREAIFLADEVAVLSRRPSSVLRKINIPYARPRSRKILKEESFFRLFEEIRFLLA